MNVAVATRCAANTPVNALRVEGARDIVRGTLTLGGPMVSLTVVGKPSYDTFLLAHPELAS
jgi:hypothetical protein